MADVVRVFLSHTSMMAVYPVGRSFVDAAADGINSIHEAKAADMKNFVARDQAPASYSALELLASDIYVGIMGFDFGSTVSESDQRSFTEFEFDTATEAGMERIVFLLDETTTATGLPGLVFTAADDRQRRFRQRLETSGLTVRWFKSPDELQRRVVESVRDASSRAGERLQHLQRSMPGLPDARRPPILFTSKSPRRRALLEQIGLRLGRDFVTVKASRPLVGAPSTLNGAQQAAVDTAGSKIDYALSGHALSDYGLDPSATIVVGADTVVFCDGRILDRPLAVSTEHAGPNDIRRAKEVAREMLHFQSGRDIKVITGLVVACADDPSWREAIQVTTTARLRALDDDEINRYVEATSPLDKAGGFGIQDEGVALFESIIGSYSNVVGLPIVEFLELTQRPIFGGRFERPRLTVLADEPVLRADAGLSVVSVGDVRYDILCEGFEPAAMNLERPSSVVPGDIRGRPGGAAVYFARAARRAGFGRSSIIGAVGGDDIGSMIQDMLSREGIRLIVEADARQDTGIDIVFRERDNKCRTLTLLDIRESLPSNATEIARIDLESADVVYLSGSCIADENQRSTAADIAIIAKKAGKPVILDATEEMDRLIRYGELTLCLTDNRTGEFGVDLLVAPLPEIRRWLGIDDKPPHDLADLSRLRDDIFSRLNSDFTTVIVRDSDRAVISGPTEIAGPLDLHEVAGEYQAEVSRHAQWVAGRLHDYLSPRVALASSSQQRAALLGQIIAPSKFEQVASRHGESYRPGEPPETRVARLALEKAELVLQASQFSENIEFIIGADTEIAIMSGGWLETIAHPESTDEAVRVLERLAGRKHVALTGVAVIGRDPFDRTRLKRVNATVTTSVVFRPLTDDEIEAYVETGEPIGRAGGYAIQGLGGLLVASIDGSYSNVVGLPLERLSEIFRKDFKHPVWRMDSVSNWMTPRPLRKLAR